MEGHTKASLQFDYGPWLRASGPPGQHRSSGPGRHSGTNLGGRDEGVRYRSPQNSSTGGSGNVWRAKTGGDGSFQQGSSSKSQPDSDAACLRSIAAGSNADGGEDCNRVEFAVGADPIFSGELQGRHEIGKQVLHQVGMVSGVVHESGKSTMVEPRRLDKDGSGCYATGGGWESWFGGEFV
ncbi:hypothetical protein Q3G72_009994 [Acer saccharum]|nr:hypothetical protein Q3G72_009994 [Acer saccharum]